MFDKSWSNLIFLSILLFREYVLRFCSMVRSNMTSSKTGDRKFFVGSGPRFQEKSLWNCLIFSRIVDWKAIAWKLQLHENNSHKIERYKTFIQDWDWRLENQFLYSDKLRNYCENHLVNLDMFFWQLIPKVIAFYASKKSIGWMDLIWNTRVSHPLTFVVENWWEILKN